MLQTAKNGNLTVEVLNIRLYETMIDADEKTSFN